VIGVAAGILSNMPAKVILILVGLYYVLKAVLLTMVSGASMASVEGVADVDDWHRTIVAAISPAFVYLLGTFFYGLAVIQYKDTRAIEMAIRRTFHFHLGWFALCLVYFLLAPLLPPLLSSYSSPGATTMRYLGIALPYVLLSVLVFVVAIETRKERTEETLH
jgi:hypothetical protein